MDELLRRFDELDVATLRERENAKWGSVGPDAIPVSVADMDLPIAEPIRRAIRTRIACDDFGYPPHGGVPGVRSACADQLASRYGWSVRTEHVFMLPGVIPGMYAAVRTFTDPGDDVLLTTPLYPWFRRSVEESGRRAVTVDLSQDADGRYALDVAGLEERIGPRTRMIMLCHPHNPTGRVFTSEELTAVAALADRHDLWVVSDELHADLALAARHVPFATTSPEAAQRTITLYGPTKAFNIAGMKIGFAVSENLDAIERLRETSYGSRPEPNLLGQVAARAAFAAADAWLDAARTYLLANRDRVAGFVAERLPSVRFAPPEGTYLAWLDFRDTPLSEAPAAYLREHAGVVLSEGSDYGLAGAGFARLNFATSRQVLDEALERIARAMAACATPTDGARARPPAASG